MSLPAIIFFDVVLFVHISAVVIGFGVTFSYALGYPISAKQGNRAVLNFARFNYAADRYLVSPAMLVVLLTGVYMAQDRYSLGDPWISATFAILIVLIFIAMLVFLPQERKLIEHGTKAEEAAAGGEPEFGPEIQAIMKRLNIAGPIAGLLTITAIFLMTTKPGL